MRRQRRLGRAAHARKSPGFCTSLSWSGDAVRRVPARFASFGGQSHVEYPPSNIEMQDARGDASKTAREPFVVRLAEPVI